MDPFEARSIWHLLETVHAVTYFADECRDASLELGVVDPWAGYFAGRAAPMGAVGAGVVSATFYGFEPAMVAAAVPVVWEVVTPDAVVTARARAAASALRRLVPGIDELADDVLGLLDVALGGAEGAGRPLYAANAEIDPVDDDVAELWQVATTLREHRGDGHVACLTTEGVGPCEAHVLLSAAEGVPAELLRAGRGWSERDWADAVEALGAAGLVDADGLTTRGRELRGRIESRTDELAALPYAVLRQHQRDDLVDALVPIAGCIVDAGVIPFPNPIGLPRVV
ncbi:MAG: hypothetical protein MUF83_06300 [Acidimicrobiales bacterium]|jgi:hypothetical protein|nr:hypothetical protein [Acidimicrobiales bacterium]